jgi:starch phosphorylase
VHHKLVFTTHTPVPAGHDRFPYDLLDRVLGPYRKGQELPQGAHVDLGRVHPGDWNEPLCMTVLALRTAGKSNGVSELHGMVSREMWHGMWPDRTVDTVPIGHVTNGVHPIFWMAPEMRALFDQRVPAWRERTWEPEIWAAIDAIPNEVLWTARQRIKRRMIATLARRTGRRLDPNLLTIGFARRFAPYKRGDMLFSDPDRLARLLEAGPFQVVYSGKAHPADAEGRKIIRNVLRWAASSRFRDRIAFVEEYDIEIGQTLTSGADVWLNNPRRPQEASGTSGQKVLLNGGLNLSILDGWWAEAWDGTNGWAIGAEHVHGKRPEDGNKGDITTTDAADTESLYRLIEHEIIPTWRDRTDGVPHTWLRRVKRSMQTGIPAFNTHRMLRDYALQLYAPLIDGAPVDADLPDDHTLEAAGSGPNP